MTLAGCFPPDGGARDWRRTDSVDDTGIALILEVSSRYLNQRNPPASTFGCTRIHGELLKLGVQVSERTVSRYLAYLRRNGDAGQRWRTFLSNHREVIAGMDFFTVLTANFRILYCRH